MFARTAFPLFVATGLLVPVVSRAADPGVAETLFEEGKRFMREDRYVDACQKFEESQKVDPGMGTEFHLADCWQHLGRLASAWALFREVESQARASGQVGRVRVAHDRATALEQSLPKVVVVPQAEAPGLEVRRDGVKIGRDQWAWPIPVDAGVHVISATAPNKQPWKTSVDVPPYGNIVTVGVPPLIDVPATASVAPPPSFAAAEGRPRFSERERPPLAVMESMPAGPVEEPIVENRGAVQRGFAWFLVGAGVAALGVGAYFGAKWLDDRNSSNAHCLNDVCDETGTAAQSLARTEERYAAVLLAGGGAVILAGAVLAVTAPPARVVVGPSSSRALVHKRATASLELAPLMSLHEGGVSLNGAW